MEKPQKKRKRRQTKNAALTIYDTVGFSESDFKHLYRFKHFPIHKLLQKKGARTLNDSKQKEMNPPEFFILTLPLPCLLRFITGKEKMPTSTPPSHPPSQLCLMLPQQVTNVPLTLQFVLNHRGEARQSGVNHTPRGKRNNRLAMLMLVVSILFIYLKHINYILSVCEEFCNGEKGRKGWKYNFWAIN